MKIEFHRQHSRIRYFDEIESFALMHQFLHFNSTRLQLTCLNERKSAVLRKIKSIEPILNVRLMHNESTSNAKRCNWEFGKIQFLIFSWTVRASPTRCVAGALKSEMHVCQFYLLNFPVFFSSQLRIVIVIVCSFVSTRPLNIVGWHQLWRKANIK